MKKPQHVRHVKFEKKMEAEISNLFPVCRVEINEIVVVTTNFPEMYGFAKIVFHFGYRHLH